MSSDKKVTMRDLCKKYNLGKPRKGSVLSEKDREEIHALSNLNETSIMADELLEKPVHSAPIKSN